MKNKLLPCFIACFLTVLILFTGVYPVTAANGGDTANETQELIGGILNRNFKISGAADIQDWINGALTQNAGISSEWYIIALRQYGKYDFSSYEKALSEYLEKNDVVSASSRLKYALVLAAVGSENEYIKTTLNDSIGKQGVMSWVYALHLLNNRYSSDEYTLPEVKEKLISLQLADGGWAITGTSGDVDVTAMTVQALAPHYQTDSDVRDSLDKALVLLSSRQSEDGDYASYGVSNPESTSQVIVTLSSLGIDFEDDSRFIKNGHSLLDGIKKYRLDDGSFSHTVGDKASETATVQVFYSLISYLRMNDGKTPLYIFDNNDTTDHDTTSSVQETTEIPSETDVTSSNPESDRDTTSDNVSGNTSKPNNKKTNYKPLVCIIIAGVGCGACLILYISKKRHIKNFIAVLIVTALAICVVCVIDIQSADDYYNGEDITKTDVLGTITLTIRCDTIVGKSDSEYIPSDGIILDVTEFEITEGDTVYDILTEAARKYHIQIENNGNSEMAYISGINYLYEFDFGDLSGWVYHVNGISQSVGCGEYELSDGDTIEWLYTCDLGNDVK